MFKFHNKIEKNSILLVILTIIVISIGGLVEIIPLFFANENIKPVSNVRPYSPLELAGFKIYKREGCYGCHSQQVRVLRDEVERYGHYSIASESIYDYPFQWGSKRTGPDLARVGGKYSDEWHKLHFIDPKSVVPESIMPSYHFLADKELDIFSIKKDMIALKKLGVPYSKEMINNYISDAFIQASNDRNDEFLRERYNKINVRDFDGNPNKLTELDAIIAYLQLLGTMVDFK